ncbi:SO2930 family diheme c-type cytochrome [Neptunicella sp. SCSIO 80796]|uniref:SO2930 family diheme c-type cytochrome n=1 Tax=Neptunicella plasticusilytica TaxID=3117012 RepID=UPI003A4D4494
MIRTSCFLLALFLLGGCSKNLEPVNFIADDSYPDTLSEWHVLNYANGELTPNKGVVPYDLNMQLFTDHAHKFRTVWMPDGKAAEYNAEDEFNFPVGTIISKTFYYPRLTGSKDKLRQTEDYHDDFTLTGLALDKVRLIETRLLIHQQQGWVALPYVWNAEQTEAVLEWAGDAQALSMVDDEGQQQDFIYMVPDANQCAGCHAPNHTSKAIRPIGPKARHLNKVYGHLGSTRNQLLHWQELDYLTGFDGNIDQAPKNASFKDASATTEQLARSYLDINCGHCHNQQGAADTSGLWLARNITDMRRLGLCKPPVAAGRGAGNGRFAIDPGHADISILSYRMNSVDPGEMMPELGRSTTHAKGVALINDWINSMDGDCQ